ncbi:G patch domain-containing protein 8-like isoform X2 [Polyodon spathula]|nr:G patch domain-containing protein 8-like isoform X2 [Polyodon spathula]XP_041121112.1 G patch domain-containing protein 8-like isoform X2 [Polyodon spathula]
MQGRTDPVPIILKYDVMGMGRMEMELDYAEDVTERRRALEVEKEDTEELRQKYKDYAEKEKAIAKALEDLRANFYCELCDKQYQKHQEFDNHINSYDHAHKQRLKELKQREFARNVSSKLRRDEKKQEKALRRLHELAEQRKQQDCAPGSGPMFKATTVAVDEESSEDGSPVLAGAGEGVPAEEKGIPSYGQIVSVASPKQAATTTILPIKNNSSTPQPKVGFSFSFAKKVPVKLETTASVFKELGEEVLADESQKEEEEKGGCDPLVPPKFPGGDSPLSTQAKAASGGEEERQDSEGGALASTLSKLKMMMKREEGASHQEPQYYHYIPPAHCRVKPNFQFLLFMRASDQSSCGGESSKQGEGRPGDIKPKEIRQRDSKRTDCKHKEEHNSHNRQIAATAEPVSNMVKVTEKVGSPKVTSSEKQPVEYNKTVANDSPRQPSGPFFPVLSKDESTTLQWPSELLEFTRAQPSLSYSCNPLYFDFKLSRKKNAQGKLAVEESVPVHAREQQAASQKARLETEKPTGNTGEGTGNKPEQTAAASGDRETEPALTSPAPKKDKTLKSHKQKKKKKHKKSSKRSKRKERGSGVGKSKEAPDEKCKRRKKHKRKKCKSRVSEERESQGFQATEVSGGGKRNHQRTATEESSRGSQAKSSETTSSSEEHNDAKRHKSDPVAVASSSSSLWKRSSSRGRSQSQHGISEEDESEDGDSSRRKSSSSRTPRQHQHYSEEDSECSLSRSSRRGGRCHSQQASSHSRSDSSSSGRSSKRSSRYSGRSGRSSSDSYSDYSERSRQRSHSKHSPTSDSDCSRHSRSHRRQHSSSESSRSRSNSRGRDSHWRRSHHRSSCSSSRSPSWKRSQSSYSCSSGSRSRRSSSSTKGSSRGGNRHRESSSELRRRRDFNRSKIYRSQSPHCSSRTPARREETRTSSSSSSTTTTSLQRNTAARGGAALTNPEPKTVVERNSLTPRQLLEKVQSHKGPEDGPTASGNAGIKLMDPPQGYFGPKLPPLHSNKAVFPLFGKLPVVKNPLMCRSDRLASEWAEEMEIPEADAAAREVVFVEPIREFPPRPPPLPPPPQLGENGQAPQKGMPTKASSCLFEPEPGHLFQPYPSEPCQDRAKTLTPLEPFPPELQPFPGYTPQPLEKEEPEVEEDSSLAPLESQPITFTPEEMEKYSKLQMAAQQHIQQQLIAKQVKSFPAAANLAPAPALQPIHIQQPAAATATATSITTVQHAILQHHAAAAAAIGLHPHPHPHHHHPQQLAQVHHIPQHHLTPFSLSPLGHSLIPAHHAAFLSSHPIHIIPASAIHHTQLALHHVPHTALYPTLFAPRPAAAAAAAAMHLHPLLHPVFSGQDLQHLPNHSS